MKTIKLTNDQFNTLFEFVDQKVDYLIERSIDLQDSKILDDFRHLLDVHTVLEEASKWVTLTEDD